MARIVVFQIFSYLDWSELIWGVGNLTMYKLLSLGLNLDFIENSLIVYVFQFGIVGAIVLVGALLYCLVALGRRAPALLKVTLGAFLLVALTNNTLSSKGPAVLLIFMLAMAFRGTAFSKSRISLSPKAQRSMFAIKSSQPISQA